MQYAVLGGLSKWVSQKCLLGSWVLLGVLRQLLRIQTFTLLTCFVTCFAVVITAITTDYDVFIQIFPTADLVSTAQQRLDEIQASGVTPEQATQQMYDLLIQLSGSGGQRRLLDAAAAAVPGQAGFGNITSFILKIKNGTVKQVSERCGAGHEECAVRGASVLAIAAAAACVAILIFLLSLSHFAGTHHLSLTTNCCCAALLLCFTPAGALSS
jgi:hypothetical protein